MTFADVELPMGDVPALGADTVAVLDQLGLARQFEALVVAGASTCRPATASEEP